ncbi:MAG: hypothetical protein ACOYO0_03725 [Sandarakinorhabdus sp.]|jgi:hypothetical protein
MAIGPPWCGGDGDAPLNWLVQGFWGLIKAGRVQDGLKPKKFGREQISSGQAAAAFVSISVINV